METGAFSSVSQARAKHLNKASHIKREQEVQFSKAALLERLEKQYGDKFRELRCQNMGELWRTFVKTKHEAEAFMEIMYPQFPKQVQLAYVHMFERAIKGEIQLDDQLIFDKNKEDERKEQTTWDPVKDIEKERLDGLTNLSRKRMEEILLDGL